MHIALEAMALNTRNTGVGVCVQNLLAGLAQLKCPDRFTIYLPDFPGAADIDRPTDARVVTVPLSADSRLVRSTWRQFCLGRSLRRDDADLLHGTAYLLPVHPPVPTLVTVHDVITLSHARFCPTLNALHFKMLLARSARRAGRVIVHSRATADELVRRLGLSADRIVLLRPGISDVFFKRLLKAKRNSVALRYNLPEHYLLFAGNLDPKKDLETLLGAYQRLLERDYPGKLVLTAPMGWKKHPLVDKLDRLGEHVVMTGYVQPDDMPAVYAGADALVLPSLVEGFGLPVVEAMAVGTPVVVSDIPGLVEAAGDVALKVGTGDVAALVDALERILASSKLRADLKRRGRKHAKQFRAVDYARAHLELYHEVR